MSNRNLAELLRDPSDITDFLIAFGEQPPNAPAKARKRALEILKGLTPTQAVGILFEFARNFARMAREVADFCQNRGVALNGQIHLLHDELTLNLSALETTWAFAGPAADLATLEVRSEGLAAILADIAARLRADDLIQSFTEERVTNFGHALRRDPLTSSVWRGIHGAVDNIRHQGYSRADVHSLNLAQQTLEETTTALGSSPISVCVTTALQDLQHQLATILIKAHASQLEADGEATPWLAALTDEILLVTGQLRNLGQEFTEGERVERGFHDFLRTEFWPARWRIYELWLLTRVLKTVETVGSQCQLIGVSKDVWAVPYGHARQPVAVAAFPTGELEIYYQYWRENAAGADMPDLVVMARGGNAIAVIDPKHGPSHRRAGVEDVLLRYARNLKADLTAVVNYFPIDGYEFSRVLSPERSSSRSWILVSHVAPGTNNSRRLELCIEEALRARGFHAATETRMATADASPRRASRVLDLVYWASKEREVDEPPGLWRSAADGTTKLVQGISSTHSIGDVRIEASPDGNALIVLHQPDVRLFRVKRAARKIATLESSFFHPSIGWANDGKYFILPLSADHLFDSDGNDRGPLPEGAEAIGWDAEGHELFCLIERDDNTYELGFFNPENGFLWKSGLPTRAKQSSSGQRQNWRVQPDFSGNGMTVCLDNLGSFRVQRDGNMVRETNDVPLGVSPRSKYALSKGPHSRYGRTLLRLQTSSEAALPLVRYTGELPREVKWTADGMRLAFLTEHSRDQRPRLFTVRPGDRFARAVSLPGQEPSGFAWVSSNVFP